MHEGKGNTEQQTINALRGKNGGAGFSACELADHDDDRRCEHSSDQRDHLVMPELCERARRHAGEQSEAEKCEENAQNLHDAEFLMQHEGRHDGGEDAPRVANERGLASTQRPDGDVIGRSAECAEHTA